MLTRIINNLIVLLTNHKTALIATSIGAAVLGLFWTVQYGASPFSFLYNMLLVDVFVLLAATLQTLVSHEND